MFQKKRSEELVQKKVLEAIVLKEFPNMVNGKKFRHVRSSVNPKGQ